MVCPVIMFKKAVMIVSLMSLCLASFAEGLELDLDSVASRNHPRLFFSAAEFDALKNKVAMPENTILAKMNSMVISMADDALDKEEHLEYALDVSGRRLLRISREAIVRITSCAYAYRLTGQSRYLEKAEAELNAVCSFKDWNESHFLDVGEMALAVSVGYDWLYDALSSATKTAVERALKEKAFMPAFGREKLPWFYRSGINWNQVCNGGLTAAAIAVCDVHPVEAHTAVKKAIESNVTAMKDMYSPDGNYVEGYGYWQYGTTYEVLLLKTLEKAFGTDFGLSQTPGFLNTGDFLMFMKGICGPFNYSDCGNGCGSALAMWYFAEKLGRPDLLFNELDFIEKDSYKAFNEYRLLPMIMCFAADIDMTSISRPSKNIWYGKGENPVVLIRKDWTSSDSDAYLAVKAGKATNAHGHMDAGSFVYDAYGVRWSMDLGNQNYAAVEKAFRKLKGNLWSYKQNSRRWTLLRYNNFHHSTITLNDRLHMNSGEAHVKNFIDADGEKGIVMDMTEVFGNQARNVERTVKMLADNSVVVIDRVTATDEQPVKYSWRMITKAQPEVKNRRIILRSGDKKISLRAKSDVKFCYRTWSAEPKEVYDEPNKGVTIVGIEADIPAGKSTDFVVTLSR